MVIELYCSWVEAIQASVGRESIGGGTCSVVGKFSKKKPYSPAILPIVAVDAEILLECLDCSCAESI